MDFPGSDLREKAMYYRFDSAYKLAVNSVVWRQKERIQNAVTYFNSFKSNYKEADIKKIIFVKNRLMNLIIN